MFADCGSVDEEIMQAGVRSIGVVKLSDHSINASRDGSYYFSTKAIDGTGMSATGRILDRERRFRHGGLLILARLIKCGDNY